MKGKIKVLKGTIITSFLAIVIVLAGIMSANIKADAADIIATVTGTIEDETTPELIKLDASGVHMLIKIDSKTDLSRCKALVPGYQIVVSVYHGNDGYLHAEKVTQSSEIGGLVVDLATKKTASGTIEEGTNTSTMKIKTDSGILTLKYTAGTDFTGCSLFAVGKKVTVTYAKASNGYYYASTVTNYVDTSNKITVSNNGITLKTDTASQNSTTVTITNNITGTTEVTTGNSKNTVSDNKTTDTKTTDTKTTDTKTTDTKTTSTTASSSEIRVQGVISEGTNDQQIVLKNNEGEMIIKIDDNTTNASCRAWVTGLTITANVYRAGDAYMHATALAGVKEKTGTSVIDSVNTYTVSGSVTLNSNENILFLKTAETVMQIKLDKTTVYNNMKGFYDGENITVVIGRGDDAYMHAISITKK